MNTSQKTLPLLLALFLVPSIGMSTNMLIEFDSASDLSSNFDIIEQSAAGTISYSNDPGIGGIAGRVNLANITTGSGKGLYTVGQVDPNDGPFTASYFFLGEAFTTNTATRIALGLSPDQANLSGNTEVQARLLKNGSTDAEFEIRGAQAGDTTTTGITLTDDHWYEFSVTFSTFGTSSYNLVASLVDYGTSGTVMGATIGNASGTRTAPSDFFSGGNRVPLNIGILAQNDGGGAVALDNVSVPASAVPEPASIALLLLGGGYLVLGRRYRRSV